MCLTSVRFMFIIEFLYIILFWRGVFIGICLLHGHTLAMTEPKFIMASPYLSSAFIDVANTSPRLLHCIYLFHLNFSWFWTQFLFAALVSIFENNLEKSILENFQNWFHVGRSTKSASVFNVHMYINSCETV